MHSQILPEGKRTVLLRAGSAGPRGQVSWRGPRDSGQCGYNIMAKQSPCPLNSKDVADCPLGIPAYFVDIY